MDEVSKAWGAARRPKIRSHAVEAESPLSFRSDISGLVGFFETNGGTRGRGFANGGRRVIVYELTRGLLRYQAHQAMHWE